MIALYEAAPVENVFPWAAEWYGSCIDSQRVTKLLDGMSAADKTTATQKIQACFDIYVLDRVAIELQLQLQTGLEAQPPLAQDLSALKTQIPNLEAKLKLLFDQALTAFEQQLTDPTPAL